VAACLSVRGYDRLRFAARVRKGHQLMTDPEPKKSPHSLLARPEIRSRSLAGVFYLTSSSIANLFLGFVASLALARMLTPADFGLIAIGSTAILIGGAVADGGIGAGMIRRPEPPTRDELRTLNGIQLVLALAFCVPTIVFALNFGRAGVVTAIMVTSIPISLLSTPGRILLTREMRYDRQTVIDLGSQAAFNVYGVATVYFGAGVWGLATASVVRAITSTALTSKLGVSVTMPQLRGWRAQVGLLRFGLKFQASYFTWVAREQSLNLVVAVIAGVTPLGIWSFTNRVFQLPSIAFSSLYVVGFPAMANFLARGEAPGPIILRTVRRAAVAGAFVFPTFAAASPQLIPSIFGEQWAAVAKILPFICLSTLFLGAIAVGAHSYLSAAGRPGVVAWASASLGVVWLALTAPLLPVIGITAIGVGNLAGAIVEAFILNRATNRSAGVSPARAVVRPLGVAMVAGTAGWLLAINGPDGILTAIAAGSLTLALTLAGLWLTCRQDLTDMLELAATALRAAKPQRRATAPSPDRA